MQTLRSLVFCIPDGNEKSLVGNWLAINVPTSRVKLFCSNFVKLFHYSRHNLSRKNCIAHLERLNRIFQLIEIRSTNPLFYQLFTFYLFDSVSKVIERLVEKEQRKSERPLRCVN